MPGKNTGGPAFPLPDSECTNQEEGMTLRDYSIIHGPWNASAIMELHKDLDYDGLQECILDANTTYADMMIKEHTQ